MVKGSYEICCWCKISKFMPIGKDVCSDCWSEETGFDFNYSYPKKEELIKLSSNKNKIKNNKSLKTFMQ